ncbi:MAG: LPS export ABC transporter periplasmic protein LptC [Elusimicrobia bacterium]|nr:LPS export ABC transporter periplasmic protein LptC [Elusimicrobiota bacterium]
MIKLSDFKLFLAVSSAAVCLAACGEKNSAQPPSGPLQRGEDVIISESEMGENKWLLTTKSADYYDEEQKVVLTSPKLINKTGGKEDSSIKADKGFYEFNKGLITLSGKVTGVSLTEGATIKASKMYYDTKTRKVWTDEPVTLKRGGVTVKGAALEANADFSEIQLYRQKTQLPKELRDFDKGPVEL